YAQTAVAVNSALRIAELYREGAFDKRMGSYNDEYYSMMANLIDAQDQVDEDRAANDVQAIRRGLSREATNTYGGVNSAITAIQNGASDALGSLNQLRLNRQAAATALAKASGADFVERNGELLPLHVNTVYRRQFGVLKE